MIRALVLTDPIQVVEIAGSPYYITIEPHTHRPLEGPPHKVNMHRLEVRSGRGEGYLLYQDPNNPVATADWKFYLDKARSMCCTNVGIPRSTQ